MPRITHTRLTMRSTDLLAVAVNVKGLTAVNAITIVIGQDQEAVAVDAIMIVFVIDQDQEAVVVFVIDQDQEAVAVKGLTAVGASVQRNLRPRLHRLPRRLLSYNLLGSSKRNRR